MCPILTFKNSLHISGEEAKDLQPKIYAHYSLAHLFHVHTIFSLHNFSKKFEWKFEFQPKTCSEPAQRLATNWNKQSYWFCFYFLNFLTPFESSIVDCQAIECSIRFISTFESRSTICSLGSLNCFR